MAWIIDSLRTAISALRPSSVEALPNAFSHQLALAAYMSSGLLRKVIAIPADDRVREWRDWQADKAQIELLEAEEKRLGLAAKIRYAERLRGIGGGALILITAGRHDEELKPETIGKGGLIAINVVSRWQIQGHDFVQDLADPDYGTPRMFRVSDGRNNQDIHPSRVVCFRGDPIPGGQAIGDEEAFWGDSRLLRVFKDVQKADNAALWFSELVRKAKLLRIGIPDLDSMEQSRIDARIRLIAEGEGILNATVYRSSASDDDQGEKIDDFQVTWTGMPAMMDAFDQRVAAVADIPFTVLMGRSPAGMNSTGDHDRQNWERMVAAGQELETRPCLEQVDGALIPSALGSRPAEIWWQWPPLSTPTEAEEATRFKTTMEAVEKAQNTGAIPDQAFAEGFQSLMVEQGWMPGLEGALDKIPEDERFGVVEEREEAERATLQAANENAVEEMQQAGAINADQARALLTDARPRPLYVRRDVVNAAEIAAWARSQGIPDLVDDLHVTLVYSRQPMDWIKAGNAIEWGDQAKDGKLTLPPGGPRAVEPLGDMTAVLMFASSELYWRHKSIVEAGASHDYDDYQPHISLTKAAVDVDAIEPYRGRIVLGPEIFEEIDEGRA